MGRPTGPVMASQPGQVTGVGGVLNTRESRPHEISGPVTLHGKAELARELSSD